MTDDLLQILLLEDCASDAELILRELRREGLLVNVRQVCTAADFAAGLKDPALDLILADCALPLHGGGTALEQARLARPETPVILITNGSGEDLAIDALNGGATDYVLTPRLARLGPAVRRAMRELTRERQWRQAAVERDEAETRYRAERQRADQQLFRLNEVLRAVRDVNGLMGRERDPERLLAEACRIMVRTRGYRLVWIGRPAADSQRVMPVASAGPATDYLTGITVTCDDSPTGCGPIGTAIRRRETCVCQDTAADPAFGPWRKAALAHGFATVAAVPMLHAGHLFGAFAVYADQAGAFDGEELRLLEELAADLAFALESIGSERERIRLQEEIALREQQLSSFFSSATAGLALLDKDLRFVRVNETLADMNGVPRAEHLGRTIREIVPDLAPTAEPLLRQVLVTGQPLLNVEISGRTRQRPELQRHWIESFFPIVGRDGAPNGVGVIAVEVTAERRHDRERETTLRLLRLLNAPSHTHELARSLTEFLQEWTGCEAVGIRLRDGDDYPYCETRGFPPGFVEAENQICTHDLQGQIARDAVGEPILECMCGNVLCGRFDPAQPFFTAKGSFWSNGTTALLAGTTEAQRQARTRNRCNGEGYESVGLFALRCGGRTLGLLQINDHAPNRFTPELIDFLEKTADQIAMALAQRQDQVALRESEEKFRRIATHIDDILYSIDAETREFRYVSDTIERVLGYSLDDIRKAGGRRGFLAQVIEGGKFQRHEEIIDHARLPDSAPGTDRWESWWRCRDGSLKCMEDRWTAVYEGGRLVAIEGALRDITERRRLEEQVLQAQKMDAVGRLAGGVAHDFNNILQSILGLTEVLLLSREIGDTQRQDVLDIQNSAKRAAELTRQLLAFSRRQMIQPTVLDLNAIVSGAQRMLTRLIGEDVQLDAQLAPDLLRVRADAGQIEQVIMNLAVNARDAMPRGGRLVISTRNIRFEPRDVPTIPESRVGPFVCLAVTDTGCGMPPETMAHLFEPFFSTKGVGKGTGLGLSVIYGIVKQHDGWINVYSEAGHGSTFKVYLPVDTSAAAPGAAGDTGAADAARLCGQGERILLVEDDNAVRALALRVLRVAGYDVVAVATAAAAGMAFADAGGHFDLLLSDVVLPDQNGIELAEHMRLAEPALRVLLCSGYTDERSRWQAIEKKGFRFIHKPYPVAQLLRAVRDLLDPPSPPDPATAA